MNNEKEAKGMKIRKENKMQFSKRVRLCSSLVMLLLLAGGVFAQNPDLMLSDEEREAILKEYNNIFPIWGRKAIERGFALPAPVGININGLYMSQDILIESLGLSTGDNPVQPVDFIKFGDAGTKISTVNVRMDLWLFPFLNVYGLVGRGLVDTTVKIVAPVEFESGVKQKGQYLGFGLTGAVGIKKNWLSYDMNWSWADLEKLEDPVRARIIGIRLGRTFKSGGKKKMSFWLGTMHQKFETVTMGSVVLSEVLPPDFGDQLGDYQDSDWYKDLGKPQQAFVDRIAQAIEDKDMGNVNVNYRIDKFPAHPWNMLLGSQIELSRHWMFRVEAGLINRYSFFANINYRFDL